MKTHVVADCTGLRRLFCSKSHLSPVPSLLLSKMQTFHWFAFWFFFQCLKTVGHPAFLFILRKAGCPFLMSRKQLFRVYLKPPNAPGQRFFCGVLRHFSLKYVSIPAKKCLAPHENPSLPVTAPVFRYTLDSRMTIRQCGDITRTAIGAFA